MMDSFSFEDFSLSLSWRADAEGRELADGDPVFAVETEYDGISPSHLAVRLKITNRSDAPHTVGSAYPIVAENLRIGGSDPASWRVLKECRHKNDLPGTFVPSRRDDAFFDAFNRLSEQGSLEDSRLSAELESDEIIVFQDETSGRAIALSFRSAGIQLTRIFTRFEESKPVCVRLGGDLNLTLAPGASVCTEWAAVDFTDDPYAALDRFTAYLGRNRRTVFSRKPFVYSTWYYYGETVTEADVDENLCEIEKKKLPFDVFQIDSGWEKTHGDWEANDKFPSGMKAVADRIKTLGMTAGIWTCPFTVEFDSDVFRAHPAWFLRDAKGEFIRFRINCDFAVMDVTNPEALAWVRGLYEKLRDWGYDYHKLDFTRAAFMYDKCERYDRSVTITQAYQKAMKIIREAIGKRAYLVVCGGMYDSLIGICDCQRTGSDVKSMWLDMNGKTPKIPFTVKQNSFRCFMNGWWHNDADALMVRRDPVGAAVPHLSMGTLTDDEAELFCANQYFSGGMISSSERLTLIDEDRLLLLRRLYPILDTKVKPLGLFGGERFISSFLVEVGGWVTLCALNWSDAEKPLVFTVPENFGAQTVLAAGYYSKCLTRGLRAGETVRFGTLRPHSVEVIKLAPDRWPQIVGSNMHYSMGAELSMRLECGEGRIRGENRFGIPARYTLALPDGRLLDFGCEAYGKLNFSFRE